MRVAYICADPGIPVFGTKGASVHVQEVVRAMRRRGVEVTLFASHLGGTVPVGLIDVAVEKLPRPAGDTVDREQAALAANTELNDSLDRIGPFDLVYERYSLWSFAGIEYARRTGIPGLLEVNAPLIEEQATYRGLSDRRAAEAVAGSVFNGATAIVAVSEAIRDYVTRYLALDKNIQVIPNGVSADRFPENVRPAREQFPNTFVIGFLGTLRPWHGLLILVDAFQRLFDQEPTYRLLLVGDGPERANLERDLSARGLLDAVTFTGAVQPDEVPGYLAAMDVAVAPYPYRPDFYFSPLKVVEYMAAGLPVVASRIGQIPDLVQDGRTGLLCPPGDAEALAEALARLRLAPEYRRRLGCEARASVLERHTWDAVVARTLSAADITVDPSSSLAGVAS